jgi:hypothetical protein
MSLKFAALDSLTVLGVLGTRTRARNCQKSRLGWAQRTRSRYLRPREQHREPEDTQGQRDKEPRCAGGSH